MNKEYKPISNLWKDSKGYRYFGTLKLSSKIKYDGDDFIPLWEWVKQLQQENQQLKMINKEYERLNKEKFRGFKIINVQEYNIDELLSYKKYKDNWNKLKDMVLKLEEENKKFIKYLEDYQDGASRSLDPYDCGINDCLGDVLSKYKEIIQTDIWSTE